MARKSKPKVVKRSKKATRKKAVSARKTARQSTTRSTAGPGFDFEDRVAAWLLLKALTGQPLPAIAGVATHLQMQVDALGWALDDILLTAKADDGTHGLAASCKSNLQVTATALPHDFVARCWRQWAAGGSNPFTRGRDSLALVTRGTNNAFMPTWSELKQAAQGNDSALALGRMRATGKHRAVFDSVKSPAKDAGIAVSDVDVVAMVKTIAVIPLDFHIAESESEKQAIAQCRSALTEGSFKEGARLWAALVDYARDTRLGSGTLELVGLWGVVRSRFALKDHPDFNRSWQRLRALTTDYRATIETHLSGGIRLNRDAEAEGLLAALALDTECVIFGDSGSGKSALVKTTLDQHFPSANQVWFGSDSLDLALNEATRGSLGIDQPLGRVFDATAHRENFLIIDAAERIAGSGVQKAKALIAELAVCNAVASAPIWRVLIVAQTDAWVSASVQELTRSSAPANYFVKPLPEDTVRQALRNVAELVWLATHDDAVSALTNARALAWVVQAAPQFLDNGSALSLTAIADRLWAHWTDGKPSVQRLLLRLAEREADFEHSFALSQFDSGDAAVLDRKPAACPLRTDPSTGRIRFEHDLAADWIRFQRLKEMRDDTAQWTPLAANPFWHGALRMLGQLLLRQAVGARSAWDTAFESAERNRTEIPLADHILLDALFLDPNAEMHLDARADMLLENNGARLLRLVNRFEHVATVPGTSAAMSDRFRDISLYVEAQFRTPVYGRWPAMARFLTKHRGRIAKLASPAVAGLCERWLTSTPVRLGDGVAMPYRREFAELALASAREMQLIHAKRIMVLGDSETRLYQAAFAGAPDLPDEVAAWALEIARRRPAHAEIAAQVREYDAEQAREHQERLAADLEYRREHERRQNLPRPIGLYSGKKLPPWPLGPQGRVEGRFREVVLSSATFQAMMRATARAAGEVLLACIIESEPKQESGSSYRLDRDLGIEFDSSGYPTAPWKSPFYAFLQINADVALEFLHQLVNFSTERWIECVSKPDWKPTPLSLPSAGGVTRHYAGNHRVFSWSHHNSNSSGQLHSALAALERWLCDLVDAGKNILPEIDSILATSRSVAMLGVLVNVGKHKPDLFKGPLQPLLSFHEIYDWDFERVRANPYTRIMMPWARMGEFAFEMAKTWNFAAYREQKLREMVLPLIRADRSTAEYVNKATAAWSIPAAEKAALERRILAAELDYRNYTSTSDPATGETRIEFRYPDAVAAGIAAFQNGNARLVQALTFPDECRQVLASTRMLHAQEAEHIASLMGATGGDEQIDLDADMLAVSNVAAAAILLLRAPDWLALNPAIERRAQEIVDRAIAGIADDADSRGPRFSAARSHLAFAAYVAVERWIAQPSAQNDERVVRLLTSSDDEAVQVVVGLAYMNRARLQRRWWRLLYLALLWSGLSMLAPRCEDEDAAGRWQRWRLWLRKRSLSAGQATAASINPLAVARRVERLERKQWQRRYARDGRSFTPDSGRRLSGSLETHFLQQALAWLFRNDDGRAIAPDELHIHRELVAAFWAHQAWWLSGSGDDDDAEYEIMHEFGYAVIRELARLVAESPVEAGPALWQPVFALGAKGHHAVEHFLSCWFLSISEKTEAAEFARRWRPMIEFLVSDHNWNKTGRWYYAQAVERQVLGFGQSSLLQKMPDNAAVILAMRDLYDVWASRRLAGDEDNLAGLCQFLSTDVGKPLRMDGLRWIAHAVEANPETTHWLRDRSSAPFIEFLDVLVSDHAAELSKDAKAKQPVVALVARAVAQNVTAAAALQQRLLRLR